MPPLLEDPPPIAGQISAMAASMGGLPAESAARQFRRCDSSGGASSSALRNYRESKTERSPCDRARAVWGVPLPGPGEFLYSRLSPLRRIIQWSRGGLIPTRD